MITMWRSEGCYSSLILLGSRWKKSCEQDIPPYSGPNYYSRNQLHLHPKLGRNQLSLTLMHSPLVVSEAMVVGFNDRGTLAAIKHRAVIRGGEISHNNTPHHPIIFINNHGHLNLTGSDRINLLINLLSDNTSNSNTINSDVNKFTTHHRNVDVGARMITGQTPAVGSRKSLHLPLTRPWGLSLNVGDVVT